MHSEVCAGTRDAQVRELDTTSPGSSLGSTRVLLAQSARYPYIERAAISPDGASLTALLLSGPVPPDNKGFGPGAPERFIVRISVATGGVTATLLRGTDSVSEYLTLTSTAATPCLRTRTCSFNRGKRRMPPAGSTLATSAGSRRTRAAKQWPDKRRPHGSR